jgi:hypothetical protein
VSKPILLDRRVILGGYRISRDANQVRFDCSRAKEDAKTFEDKSDRYELGVHTCDFSVSGHATDEVERRFLAELVKSARPDLPLVIFLASGNGTPGDDVGMVNGCTFEYKASGDHGKIQKFDLSGSGHDVGMYGELLESSMGTAGITGAQNGTALNLGAVSATQKIVAHLHILHYPAAEGTDPLFDSKLQSATDEAFTTPVDRITFPQRDETPIGSVHELNGAITDTWWRFIVTAVGGTGSPKFWVVCAAAIVPIA